MACKGNSKKVKVYYTGGTIGMQKNIDGEYVPVAGAFKNKIKETPELYSAEFADDSFEFAIRFPENDCVVLYNIEEYNELIDSSNMHQGYWERLARDIERDYNSFDGFVILHGTDTLAYTASTLSFMLGNLSKPVILIGSLVPIFEPDTDAVNNMKHALLFAGCYDIPEVSIFNDDRLLRGNRTKKLDAVQVEGAFLSPSLPPLAVITPKINLNTDIIRYQPKNACKFYIYKELCKDVIILNAFPGIKSSMLKEILQSPVKGVVLQCYGSGNIQSSSDILKVIENAVKHEILIVRVSQCTRYMIDDAYESGAVLTKIGVVAGYDMTTEAVFGKLCWVLAQNNLSYQERCDIMIQDIRGELTKPNRNSVNGVIATPVSL